MSNNASKIKMKFRRIIYRIGKYSMFIFSVITCYNLTNHILELRAERKKKDKVKRAAIISLSILTWIIASFVAFALLIKYIKHLKKGYLLDLFDTEAYDVIDPDEEVPSESIINAELYNNDESAEHEVLSSLKIPLDEEASEDDYK